MEFWVGFSNFTLHTRRPLWKTYEALVSVCLILAAVSASGLYRRRRRWRPSPRLAMAWVALLWMAAPGAALCGLIQLNYPHYFAVCLPAGYLLIARLAAVLDRAPGKPPWERAFRLAPLACLAFALTLLFCLGQDLARDGGFMGGEYGRSYRTMAMGDAPWAWEEASRESGEGR
ncbi:MAG: hypothetical protein BWZ10_03173 [candidate division BRC1 bacterium ADurb.BinA364]|nr:MAG: hypothetical protein BWZ10_03173 [candidate division BRC1 bacterium ADurb.BinA364]